MDRCYSARQSSKPDISPEDFWNQFEDEVYCSYSFFIISL